ncbi:ferredoxin [Geodermatophilus sp. TF02-6]|uniref:ferredoxin n=1 Tax=Geodermatophilus sp. TF02-6 TaxID=2250575 RepID=UPI000DE8C222|nr:ferredoxin [Geodermatophilus sp. TF02-6]RBY74726.1 ferredoxin [Geodermatophilus sp. TF02-6]
MRIAADRERCVGSAACEALAPELFCVGDDGVVRVLRPEPGRAEEDVVRDTVDQCPTGALSLTD